MAGCRPRCPRATRLPPTGGCQGPRLPSWAARPFGFYVHVPFCTVRCGYCDFNTYTAEELGDQPGASRATYAEAAIAEVRLARRVLGDRRPPGRHGVLRRRYADPARPGRPGVGAGGDRRGVRARSARRGDHGGQPRQRRGVGPRGPAGGRLHPDQLRHAVGRRRRCWPPWTAPTTPCGCRPSSTGLARRASTRSASTSSTAPRASRSQDWEISVEAALACAPDHVSAYSLIVEPGTALARRVGRGELPMPDEDDLADKYLHADEQLGRAGFAWYEVSNWAREPAGRCRHNELYWTGGHWWGIGPGAHSHVGGVRWWNVKHPAAYAGRLAADASPAAARETLDAETRRVERVLLEIRLRDGLPVLALDQHGRAQVAGLVQRGLVELAAERLVLTRRVASWPTPSYATCCREGLAGRRRPAGRGLAAPRSRRSGAGRSSAPGRPGPWRGHSPVGRPRSCSRSGAARRPNRRQGSGCRCCAGARRP